MTYADTASPVDALNGPTATTKSSKPRKPKRKDASGNDLVRISLVVNRADKKAILLAISKSELGRDLSQRLIDGSLSDEFLGIAIATILKDWTADHDFG